MSRVVPRAASRWADLPAVAAIAATYAYFLLFDQFALLDLLQAALPPAAVQTAMAAMGLAGLAGSFAAALRLRRDAAARARQMLLAGYLLAAAVAAAAPSLAGPGLIAASAFAGLATAGITVPLAAALRELLRHAEGRGGEFGLRVGLGTGAAYFFCNLPGVFAAGAGERSAIAALVAAAGLLAAWRLSPAAAAAEDAGSALAPADLRGVGLASLLASFLALVWLDSAAFAVIQENGALKELTWSGGRQTLLLGAAHLLAALAAGRAIDCGRFRSLLFLAYLLFAAALGLLAGGGAGAALLAGPLYAAAVSIYSVALVAFPAYGREAPDLPGRRHRAALVFGVAGWIGSALGVGMAQSLHRVPPLFLLAAGTLLAAAGLFRGAGEKARRLGAALLSVHGATLLGLAAGLLFFTLEAAPGAPPPPPGASGGDAVARGRLVYIGEGCIYCHSQYVRPGTRDEALWGPHRELDRSREQPPLIGLRRQGPDLSNAGRRRDAAFLSRQLREPRSVASHSAMPSYAHLFAPGDHRGEDLVAYLESLR